MDFAGPFPSGDYLLVLIDEYSRYPEVEVVGTTSYKTVTSKLETIFARQGLPEVIKTDNGPPFNGAEFSTFLEQLGIQHKKVTPLWPEANGEAERFMRTLNKNIRAATAANLNWKTRLPVFLMQYRATPHASTNVSPFEALTGRKMNTGLPVVDATTTPSSTHSRIALHDAKSKQKMTSYTNAKRHATPHNLQVGDHVLIKQPKTNKLTPPFNPKPYTIIMKKGTMLTAQRGSRQVTRNSSHFKHIPPTINRDEDADSEEEEKDEMAPPVPERPPTPERDTSQPAHHTTPDQRRLTPPPGLHIPAPGLHTPMPSHRFSAPGPRAPELPSAQPMARPARERRLPERLKDFVLQPIKTFAV